MGNEAFQNASFENASFGNGNEDSSCLSANSIFRMCAEDEIDNFTETGKHFEQSHVITFS